MSNKESESLNLKETDAIDSYFECITACSLNEKSIECVTECVSVHLKGEKDSWKNREY